MSTERIIPKVLTGHGKDLSEAIRDATFELMSLHERPEHAGSPCGMNRISHVAWIAHSLGVGSAHLQKLMAAIAMYEADCPCGVPTLAPEHFENH
jgi:hypothetical protein